MNDRSMPFLMAALAGVMANPVLTHAKKTPDELAELALAAARATAAKLEALGVEVDSAERIASARHDVDELGELRARVEALELELKTRPVAGS